MTINSCIDSVKGLPYAAANIRMEELCGVSRFFETASDLDVLALPEQHVRMDKEEYGDWQTNMELALAVCRLLKKQGANPQILVEPTCGRGHFILAALRVFDGIKEVYGIEIYKPYLDDLKVNLLQYYIDHPEASKVSINLLHQNIFDFDFTPIKRSVKGQEVLVIGNPPWVTNSKIGALHGSNLPEKSNVKKAKGLDAMTGKGNFDIAEAVCRKMMAFLSGEHARMVLLLKNSVIKNLVYGSRQGEFPVASVEQYGIDAKREFGASVAASLACVGFGGSTLADKCLVRNFYTQEPTGMYGWVGECFVADMQAYQRYQPIDGVCPLEWRSGLKHDCAKVMELALGERGYVNGFGQPVDIEEDRVYPLLKSSDIKEGTVGAVRKYVVVTQNGISGETFSLEQSSPNTYRYLLKHADLLDNRGSSIYKKRPRFSIFGIGGYSFKPYKVVVSGLYKHTRFAMVATLGGKPVMLDDTCYMLGFDEYEHALITQRLLNSGPVQAFIRSLLFADAKRVVNKDLLMRIDLLKAMEFVKNEEVGVSAAEWERYSSFIKSKIAPMQ